MKDKNVSAGLHIYVKNHNRAVKFFEEMGLHTFDQQSTEGTITSAMHLNSESDLTISIIQDPLLDEAGSIMMAITDRSGTESCLTKIFLLKEENYFKRVYSAPESNSDV